MHSSKTLNKPMLESKSRCLIFSCIWLEYQFFRMKIACLTSAYIGCQPQSQSSQTSSSFRCSLSPSLQHYLCVPSHSSTCTHCPLYKRDLWKHGLLFPTAGHWFVPHLPPLPSYGLYWNNTGTESSLLEETEAHGEMHNQRDNQPFLPLHLWSSEESQQGREREELTPNSCLVVLLANGDRRSESTTGQNSSLY